MNLAALIVGILTVVFTVDDVSAEVNVGKLNIGNIKQELLCTMNIRWARSRNTGKLTLIFLNQLYQIARPPAFKNIF